MTNSAYDISRGKQFFFYKKKDFKNALKQRLFSHLANENKSLYRRSPKAKGVSS